MLNDNALKDVTKLVFYYSYELEGFDKNYQPFMEAFGIPSFVVSFILGAEETFIVTIAENKKTIHFKTIMGKDYLIYSFQILCNTKLK